MKQVKPQTADEYFAKRKPRRWWVNLYRDEDGWLHGWMHSAKERAIRYRAGHCSETICVEEVPDDSSE